jgi:hypothetical protein
MSWSWTVRISAFVLGMNLGFARMGVLVAAWHD